MLFWLNCHVPCSEKCLKIGLKDCSVTINSERKAGHPVCFLWVCYVTNIRVGYTESLGTPKRLSHPWNYERINKKGKKISDSHANLIYKLPFMLERWLLSASHSSPISLFLLFVLSMYCFIKIVSYFIHKANSYFTSIISSLL